MLDFNLFIKLLTWMASPMGAFTVGAVLSCFLLMIGRARRFRTFVIAMASLQLLFFSMPVVSSRLHTGLEDKSHQLVAQRLDNKPYAGVLLLGGVGRSFSPAESQQFGRADFADGVDRVLHSARLYHEGLAPRIIISGGNWQIGDTERPSEASIVRELLISLGVAPNDIFIEEKSRTTRENFLFTDALLKQLGLDGSLALVTSATHMPRAMRNASTLNVNVAPYPTDWRSTGLKLHPLPWLPNAEALSQSEVALKEWLAAFVSY